MTRMEHRLSSRALLQWLGAGLCVALASPGWAVPSFARQTGMACAACHTVFPELTPFGREFKLNGYVLDNIKQVTGIDTTNRQTLALNSIPPISLMAQISYTHTSAALPDSAISGALAKDGDLLFPQQVSFFYAGKIADGLGAFIQLTYDGVGDSFGFDNTDIRYAHHLSFGGANGNDHDMILGVTLNNNPTVQDVWNTTPAWGFPYSNSSVAPGPITSTKVESGAGGFGQNVGGLGVYMWLDDHFYAEITDYTSAIRGGAHPLDSTQSNVVSGSAPYWRVAYEQRWDRNSLSVGAFGLSASTHPGLRGRPIRHCPGSRINSGTRPRMCSTSSSARIISSRAWQPISASAKRSMPAFSMDSPPMHDSLKTLKLTGEYYYQRTIGGTIGYFSTTGSHDPVLYTAAPVGGSANDSPDSSGYILEVNYLPWLNTKLQAQYVGYQKFNGQKTNYDGSGRNASDNNTMYLLVWLNF